MNLRDICDRAPKAPSAWSCLAWLYQDIEENIQERYRSSLILVPNSGNLD